MIFDTLIAVTDSLEMGFLLRLDVLVVLLTGVCLHLQVNLKSTHPSKCRCSQYLLTAGKSITSHQFLDILLKEVSIYALLQDSPSFSSSY